MADEADKELQLKVTTTFDGRGTDAADKALDGVAGAAKKSTAEFTFLGKTGEQIRSTGEAAAAAGRGAESMSHNFREAGHVMRGAGEAAEGGARSFLGMFNVMRGAQGLLGPLGLALGAVAAAIAYVSRVAEKNKKDIEEMFAEHAKGSDAAKAHVEAFAQQQEKVLEKQRKEVEKLTEEYERLVAAIDHGAKQAKALNDARTAVVNATIDRDEQAALAKAKTPEEAARISARFASRRDTFKQQGEVNDLRGTEGDAKLKLDAGLREEAELRDQREKAQARFDAAQQARDEATAASSAALKRFNDLKDHAASDAIFGPLDEAATEAARKNALTAQSRALNADSDFKRVKKDTEGQLTDLDKRGSAVAAQIQQARDTLELVAIQRESLRLQQETASLAKQNAAKPEIAGLKEKAGDAMARGDFKTQDQLTADIRAKEADLKKVAPAVLDAANSMTKATAEVGGLVITAINGVSTQQKKVKAQLLNSREQTQ